MLIWAAGYICQCLYSHEIAPHSSPLSGHMRRADQPGSLLQFITICGVQTTHSRGEIYPVMC